MCSPRSTRAVLRSLRVLSTSRRPEGRSRQLRSSLMGVVGQFGFALSCVLARARAVPLAVRIGKPEVPSLAMNLRDGSLPLTWQRLLIYIALGAAVGIFFPDASFLVGTVAVVAVAILVELGIWLLQRRH